MTSHWWQFFKEQKEPAILKFNQKIYTVDEFEESRASNNILAISPPALSTTGFELRRSGDGLRSESLSTRISVRRRRSWQVQMHLRRQLRGNFLRQTEKGIEMISSKWGTIHSARHEASIFVD